jgi:hypothetical protein
MAAPQNVVQAVQAGIVASAHLSALEHVSAAAQACQRLGNLTSGRWRAAARELASIEEDLQTAYVTSAETLTSRADELGVPEDALWTAGDAAGTLEMLRDSALEELDEDEPSAARVLDGDVLFGASFVEDPDLPDRGTTLLFGWPDPLAPASWPWQANWVVGDGQDTDGNDESEELDLFEAGEMEGDQALLDALITELDVSEAEARSALRAAAMALTRASLLAGAGGEEEEEEGESEDDEDNGA